MTDTFVLLRRKPAPDGKPLFVSGSDLGKWIASWDVEENEYRQNPKRAIGAVNNALRNGGEIPKKLRAPLRAAVRERLSAFKSEEIESWLTMVDALGQSQPFAVPTAEWIESETEATLHRIASAAKLQVHVRPRTQHGDHVARYKLRELMLNQLGLRNVTDTDDSQKCAYLIVVADAADARLSWEDLFKEVTGMKGENGVLTLEQADSRLKKLNSAKLLRYVVVSPEAVTLPITVYDPRDEKQARGFVLFFSVSGDFAVTPIPPANVSTWRENFYMRLSELKPKDVPWELTADLQKEYRSWQQSEKFIYGSQK